MEDLITGDLFKLLLSDPIERGARELFVVSGYASSAMVTRHFEHAAKILGERISIDLFVGMTGKDGMSRANLSGFQAIPRQASGQSFNCTFSPKGTSNHSKVYVWCDERGPTEAFLGSNNYTQVGFGISPSGFFHSESCVRVDAAAAFSYVLQASKGSISYRDSDLYKYIDLYDEQSPAASGISEEFTINPGLPSVLLPLVQMRGRARGNVHERAGLNWGQRDLREPNQAYIPIPANVARSHFFPPKGVHFQMTTNDGEAFMCTVAQDGDKALETPYDNSILGKYFRKRLGLEVGALVTDADLSRFGSNAIKVSRVDDESYYLEFQPGLLVD